MGEEWRQKGAAIGRRLCRWVALFAWMPLVSAAFGQDRRNVMANGGFEEGMVGWQSSVNGREGLGGAVAVDSSRAREGGKSLKTHLPGQSSAAVTSAPAPVQAGTGLPAHALVSLGRLQRDRQLRGRQSSVRARLARRRRQAGWAGGMGLSYGAVPEWPFTVSMLTAPPGAASLRIRFLMSVDEAGRPSSFWLEDVRLRAWPGEPKRGGKTWVFSVADGHYQQELFRRAADDDASTGFAVLAAPRFSNRPGYLLGNLYTLAVPPGQHRGTHYQF